MNAEHKRDYVEFVRLGFNDACDNFLVNFNRFEFDNLRKAIASVDSYNEFSGKRVAAAFKKIEHLALSAEFGREGSPVLYIRLRRQDAEVPGTCEPIGAEEVLQAFKSTKVDEAGARPNDAGLIRLWWD